MGAPCALPLLLLLASRWAPGGATLSQDRKGRLGIKNSLGLSCNSEIVMAIHFYNWPNRRKNPHRAGERQGTPVKWPFMGAQPVPSPQCSTAPHRSGDTRGSSLMETLSPGYWQEQDLELGTLAPVDEAISSTVWSSPDMLASQDSQPWTSDETVVAGGTVVLKCQVREHEDSSLQWSNPAQQTLYFGEKRALRDNRIQLVRSTHHELSISISNVALADEGEYTCSIFTMPVRTAKSLVTVLGEAPACGPRHAPE
ncbi:Cell adhesion molecule 3 [Galemys pyrenaicus]|uniref:Cell adhesion molecule 3 n=1 Tax=Galemys pyrenaicus TaxID=202257 RepID=A0A8J5ZZD2_GALPY|nr:Cell adhesion molecule 3 [Galemys pyrenaicus]